MYLNLNVSLHFEILLTSSVMGCICVCMRSKFIYVEVQGLHCTFFQDYSPDLVFEPRSLAKPKVHTLGFSGWTMSSSNLPISTSPKAGVAGTPRHTQLSLHWFEGSKFSFLHLESRQFNNWALSLKNMILKWFRNLLEGRYCKVMKYVCNSQLTTCGINLGFHEWDHG